MIKTNKINVFGIISILVMVLSKPCLGRQLDIPSIKAGSAKITGSINYPNKTNGDTVIVTIVVPNPISGEFGIYRGLVNQSGKFAINVDIETNFVMATLNTSIQPQKSILVKLANNNSTNIDLTYNSDSEIKSIKTIPIANYNDMLYGVDLVHKMVEHRGNRPPQKLFDKSTDYFLDYAKTILSERLSILEMDTLISKELKRILSKDFSLFLYNTHVLPYESEMRTNYRAMKKDKSKEVVIQKIDTSYFRFLKDFKLNDPEYLVCITFAEFQKSILQNEILGIPEIGESDIPTWLGKAKAILANQLGFNSGLYYDILAANAYSLQLSEKATPLNEKQKQNIINYWNDGEIAKILFRKNQRVVEFDKFKAQTVVNDVSSISENKVIETIVSKHKGKVVLIDFWATWCSPCLDAMQEFRTTKNEFYEKDVVFVYLASISSPKKLWADKIKGIGSEHYYLTDKQWGYIMDNFDFTGIPSYLLYNKEGKLTNKFTAFPGSEKVKKMIDNLL